MRFWHGNATIFAFCCRITIRIQAKIPQVTVLSLPVQQSPDFEEPDVLNTPKSLAPTTHEEETEGRQVASRRLFPDRRSGRSLQGVRREREEAWPRHPAPTSQVNEYENISPTPSTDL
jgi:hypothetical protein